MLKFLVYQDGEPATEWALRNAHLIGSDGSTMRGDIRFDQGLILCEKREAGSMALALQYPVDELGEMTLQTCLLPDKDQPYLLSLEIARHRLMMLYTKLEDWGLMELDADHPLSKRADNARQLFIEALCLQREHPLEAEKMARQCLNVALDSSEELALAHSELLLNRRKSTGALPVTPIGCGIASDFQQNAQRQVLADNFDFVQLPLCWKQLAPEEGEYRWQSTDDWTAWTDKKKLTVVGGPLLSFDPTALPDWLYIWEHDYDTVRDLVYEHVERVVSRYHESVDQWLVVSGLHVNRHFSFNFEQLMDLTRMTTLLVRKLAPNSRTMIELRQPFGEYYGNNPRSIPPMMYSDLITQSGIPFDALALRLLMGQAQPGQYTRDLMQVSLLLDQYAVFGKPVHLTIAAPSEPVTEMMIALEAGQQPIDPDSGQWRRPWSPQVQAHWMEAVFQIALARPFVESVAWDQLIDHPQIELPLSGLTSESAQTKPALRRIVNFRRNLLSSADTLHIEADENEATASTQQDEHPQGE